MKKRILSIFLWFLFSIIFLCITAVVSYRIQEWITMKQIASRLNTGTGWDTIYSTLDKKEFRPGMTRDEVHAVLDKMGPWEGQYIDDPAMDTGIRDWEKGKTVFREKIRFTNMYTYFALGGWMFFYDINGVLVDQARLDSGV